MVATVEFLAHLYVAIAGTAICGVIAVSAVICLTPSGTDKRKNAHRLARTAQKYDDNGPAPASGIDRPYSPRGDKSGFMWR